jgi:DNA-binding NtrC family response regulator
LGDPFDTDATLSETLVGAAGTGSYELADLCLAVSTGGPFETYELPVAGELVLGRSHDADVRVEDRSVSRKHAVIRTSPVLAVQDLGSSNGTRLRGQKIPPDEIVRFAAGDLIELGSAMVVVRPASSGLRPRRMWGHGYFEGRVEEECARAARSGAEFAVLRVSAPASAEADEFEGALIRYLRNADVVARYAPREYEVLLLDVMPERAFETGERLAESVGARLSVHREAVATGLACFPHDDTTADRLIARACAAVRGESVAPRPPVNVSSGRWQKRLRKLVAQIATSDLGVLLLGETGVGKEVCAEALHVQSTRRRHKLLRLNCAALTETLLESELFGHERGSFTGADRAKPGLLETAAGGTVFLDEIGELPMSIQVKLLRVLEDRKVQRVGALEPRSIDVRFVAATNRDLDTEVAAGRFRQDLLYRLNGFTVHIPPLRERTDEIEPLARMFSGDADITQPALERLLSYSWPGNIRELRNVMERAVVLAGMAPIGPEHLPLDKMLATVAPSPLRSRRAKTGDGEAAVTGKFAAASLERASRETQRLDPIDTSLHDEIRNLERDRIVAALDQCAGNQTKAARALGISRGTLIKRLDAYGIPRPRKVKRK